METIEHQYIGHLIGQMEHCESNPPEVQMFSFNRAARMFYQGIYEAAIESGMSHEKALALLTHTWIRYMLDNDEELTALGRAKFHSSNLKDAPNLD